MQKCNIHTADALKKNKELLDEELQRRRTSVRRPTQLPDENDAGGWNVDVKDSKQTISEIKKLAPILTSPLTQSVYWPQKKSRKD